MCRTYWLGNSTYQYLLFVDRSTHLSPPLAQLLSLKLVNQGIESAMSSSRVTVSVKSFDDGGLPLLVAFPQGVPNDGDDMQIIFGQKGDGKKRKQMVLANLNGTKYKGDDFGDNSKKNDNCKFAVGFLPEGSKEMTIFQADHIFVMKPQFDNQRVPARSTSMTNAERKQSLTEEFGSRKKKRALKAAQSNTISSENIAGASAVESAMVNQMDDTDANSILVNAAEDALEKNRLQLLPTYDVLATAAEDAYPMKSLIPPSLATALKERYQVMNAEMTRASLLERGPRLDIFSWVQRLGSEVASSLVSSSLRNLPTEDGKPTKKFSEQFSISVSRILLLHYMLRFYLKIISSHDRVVTREDIARDLVGAPVDVLDFFADTFCVRQSYRGKPAVSCSKANM